MSPKSAVAVALLGVAALPSGCAPPSTPELRSVQGDAQGTTYSLQWSGGATEDLIAAAAATELARIDALLSNYRVDSTLERFNAQRTTEPIELPSELVALVVLAKRIHSATDGCFDPTVRPLVRAWGFDGESPAVPPAERLAGARAAVGLDKLVVEGATTVRKLEPNLELDMASIGQGYSAERLALLLEQTGTTDYLAEIGGEIVARGAKPGGTPWRVGVESPAAASRVSAAIALRPERRTAVITSGIYRHFFTSDGHRFGHVIDPRTGYPAEHSLVAVTVLGSDGAATAAWATALMCLGPSAASLVVERERLPAVLWNDNGESNPSASSALRSGEWGDWEP